MEIDRKYKFQMAYKPQLNCHVIKFCKIKASTKVWKIQIELPSKLNLTKSSEGTATTKWTIWQILN